MPRPLPQITLEQYAGIQAAIADGHALEAVLAQEGIPPWRWPDLERGQLDAITKDPALFEQYCAKLVEAEDVLARRIAPLDDDLTAWTGFVAALCAGQRTAEQHGLRPTDVKRLQRAWQRRFDDDSKLVERASRLAAKQPAPPAKLDLGPLELRAFPWSPDEAQAAEQRSLEPLAFLAATRKGARPTGGAPLPFSGYGPPPPGNLGIELVPGFGETAALGPSARRSEPATPFEPVPAADFGGSSHVTEPALSPPSVPGPVAASHPPALAPRPVVGALEPHAELGRTKAGSSPPRGPTLPFSGTRPPPASAVGSLEPIASLGATAVAKPRSTQSPAATPFASAAGDGLDRYARLCAELDAAGSSRAAVLARHGIDEAQLAKLQAHYREAFVADETLRARWAGRLFFHRERLGTSSRR